MGTRQLSSGTINLTAAATVSNTLNDGSIASATFSAKASQKFTDGVSGNQFNRAWGVNNQELASSSTVTYNFLDFTGKDLGAGDAKDALGQSMDFEEMVLFWIKNLSTSSGTLRVTAGGGIANGVDWLPDTYDLPPGAQFIAYSPGTDGLVVSSTKKIVKVEAVGKCYFEMFAFGRNDTDESSSSSSSTSSSSSSTSSSSQSSSSSESSLSTTS